MRRAVRTAQSAPACAVRSPLVARASLALLAVLPSLVAFAAGAQDAAVRGTVRGPDGRPVALAEVLVDDSARVRTDSAGAFTIAGLPARAVELTVRRVGFAPLSLPLTLVAGQRRTLAIELAPLPYALTPVVVSASRPGLFGTVVDTQGAPLAGATVVVVGAARNVTTAADGGFALPALAPKPYVVLVQRPGHRGARFSVVVPADRGQELRVEMEPIGDEVTGGARRAAEGTHWLDVHHMRELERRLQVNPVTLIPRAALATQGSRAVGEVLRSSLDRLTMLSPGGRGTTSLPGSGANGMRGAAAEAAANAGNPSFGKALSGGGATCYFLDGEYPLPATLTYIQSMPAEWIESIEVSTRDHTGTLRQRLPFDKPSSSCGLFVVIWLRD